MQGRDLDILRQQVMAQLGEIGLAGCNATDIELALRPITRMTYEQLGDRSAHLRPGALKGDESQFFVSGIFLVAPSVDRHVLVAEHGFPAEQHRLQIPLDTGHPGWVYQHQQALILANTDDHSDFKQILKTSRMGSAIFAPMFWQGEMIGQLITAAQARHTFEPADLDILVVCAHFASTLFAAHRGCEFLSRLF